jgi:hypothetical protein
MFGILTTLQTGRGSQLVPAAMPLALVPTKPSQATGSIAPDHPAYHAYRQLLDRAMADDFVRLFPPVPTSR